VLANVLLVHVLRLASAVLGALTLLLWIIWGQDPALGFITGGMLIVFDGVALTYLVGRLLDPTVSGTTKGVFTLVLVGKLTIVAGLLWACLAVWGVHELGLLIGLGIGLMLLVLGLNRGSTSKEGLEAIREAEARIAQEMGDNEDELG
jgi:hypothetical protein